MSIEKNSKTNNEINLSAGYKTENLNDIKDDNIYYTTLGTDEYKKRGSISNTSDWTFPYGTGTTGTYYTGYDGLFEITKVMERFEERLSKLEDRLCILEECDAEEIDTLKQMFEEYKTMERMLTDKANKKKNNG